ncbi:hypothetical protein BKA64DRAFT_703123 [Cadophora sp. MPI-SDFR-AT-0126]|nr:hypothetical protein BKA64DRAFT_703123 [Leotiomycetes sp. MPI-SDFR-AT-0126]
MSCMAQALAIATFPMTMHTPQPLPDSHLWILDPCLVIIILKLLVLGIQCHIMYHELRAGRAERRAARLDEEMAVREGEEARLVAYELYDAGDEKVFGYVSA